MKSKIVSLTLIILLSGAQNLFSSVNEKNGFLQKSHLIVDEKKPESSIQNSQDGNEKIVLSVDCDTASYYKFPKGVDSAGFYMEHPIMNFHNEQFYMLKVLHDSTAVNQFLFKFGGDGSRSGMHVQLRSDDYAVITTNNAHNISNVDKVQWKVPGLSPIFDTINPTIWGFSARIDSSLNNNAFATLGFWRNGEKIDSTNIVYATGQTTYNETIDGYLGIKGSALGLQHPWYGRMYDVLTFNVVPTNNEIEEIFNHYQDSVQGKFDAASKDSLFSGELVIGQQYKILDNSNGADFTTVGANNNDLWTKFTATSTGPVNWGGGALLAEGLIYKFSYNKTDSIWYDDKKALEAIEFGGGDIELRLEYPTEYSLIGGGEYCNGDGGVEILLEDSESFFNYELYLDGVPTGNIVAGTGEEISFGYLTEEGYYTAYARIDQCEAEMLNEVSVTVLYIPGAPSFPTGPQLICGEEQTIYESDGAFGAESYTWTISPEEAGTLNAEDLIATVDWNPDFTGNATISISGTNECGTSDNSSLEIEVSTVPAPAITGENMVCNNQLEEYSTEENLGSIYIWEVSGGSITEGDSSSVVNVQWDESGMGLLSVTEVNESGCEALSENFEVVIDDCTAISEFNFSAVKIFPNPAENTLNIKQRDFSIKKMMIYSFLGKTVKSIELKEGQNSDNFQVDISMLKKGTYFIKLVALDNSEFNYKFIKL